VKKYKKILIDAILFFVIIGLTLYGVFHGEDLSGLKDAIKESNILWLIPAVPLVLFFIAGESIVIWHMLDCYGIYVKERFCFLFSAVGFFFSCVTPSATGGQPMQIYFMKKEDIPVPIATVILLVVTITYKFVLVVVGIGLWLFAGGFLAEYVAEARWVFYLGILLNVGCVILMCVVVFHPSFAKKTLILGAKLLERIHILKHKEERLDKIERSMNHYHEAAEFMSSHWGMIARVFVITVVQRFAMFAVTYFVYRAFSLNSMNFFEVMFLQAVISVSVDMLPLPGGMGISEGLFMVIFKKVFGEALLIPGLILSRGLGYYSELFLSAIFTLVAVVVFQVREHKKSKVK
jgi:uncharacterized protein (TIRG00374 family)